MKQLFFLFGLSALAYGSSAQQQNGHQHTGDKFGVSVFANSHNFQPEKRADIGISSKLSARFPGWYIATDRWTGGFKELNGKPFSVPGSTLEAKARTIMAGQLAVAGIKAEEWVLDEQQTNLNGFTYLYFHQEIGGKKVAFAKMHFRFTQEGQIARINMKGYGQPDLTLVPSVSTATALGIAATGMDGAVLSTQNIDENWEWFPIPSDKGFELHPAFKFALTGTLQESGSIPLNISGYVDAVSGTLLYRDNETKDATDLKVVGSIYTDGYLNPTKIVGLPYISATLGGGIDLIADENGFLSHPTIGLPSTYGVTLKGNWSEVRSQPDGFANPVFETTVTALGQSDSFGGPMSFASSSRHINAYYHVNTVHDFMKKQYGAAFTGLDYPLVTNVDVTGTCNAFYTGAAGGSINFFPAGGGCVSFAEVRDVVYHEYGHAIVSKMYTGGGMRNGGLNEGQADVWAMSITKDSVMARGTNTGAPGSFIRRYDIAPKVFPADLTGEVHANGEIIAGAWWDYGKNVGNIDTMSKLFATTLITDRPDGPNGTEGEVFFEVLMSALINDDNDADLSNGTPHFNEIVTAFAKHGIYLLYDLDIEHTELGHQPTGVTIPVTAQLRVSNPLFFKGLNLVYRTSRVAGTSWNTIPMVDAGGYKFSCEIPAQTEGVIVDYYFSSQDIANLEGVFFPYGYYPSSRASETKSNLNYQFAVGIASRQVVDFESSISADWQLGAAGDNAGSGVWIQAVPVASSISGRISQTGNDHTSGSGQCLVTGNAATAFLSAYTASVKNGRTTATTPMYDISGYTNPIVEYYRWFGNNRGNFPNREIWRVQMSGGSTFIFLDVENTNQSDFQWRRKMFKPRELFPGASKMQLRFMATENPPAGSSGNGLVEAAVDDFVIYEGESATGIKENNVALASIYPNPATDLINIILPPGNFKELSISFCDMSGRVLNTVPVTKGASRYAVETRAMVPGQYSLVIRMDKTIQTQKVTIKGE